MVVSFTESVVLTMAATMEAAPVKAAKPAAEASPTEVVCG